MRRLEGRVNPTAPRVAALYIYRWQREVERLPVGVQEQMNAHLLPLDLGAERQAVRTIAPVWVVELDAVPGFLCRPQQLVQADALVLGFHVSQQPSGIEQGHEAMHIGVLRHQGPVEPARLVVLAVGVVVAALGAPHFVAHENHRHT